MAERTAVVVGFIGKLPLAGMALYVLHYAAGLRELGYRVHYVERQDYDCYDPDADALTTSPAYALGFLADLLPRHGIGPGDYSFVDRDGRCHGSGWSALRARLDAADFVLAVADASWFDELGRCPRRAFVDGDPVFTQAAMLAPGDDTAAALAHYDPLFTIGSRIGSADCTVPDAGRRWIPTRSVVATRLWRPAPAANGLPVRTVMAWRSGSEVVVDGRAYGHKDREFERFAQLPRRARRRLAVAIGGKAPKRRFAELGWEIVDPLAATKTVDAYRAFIAGSRADLGIAKHAYVASRSGWFSDRSLCYLASGRPVLHQDTGFGDWLPAGAGVLAFSDLEDALAALERLEAEYDAHARAARAVAEEHFEARAVLARMLDEAGFR